MKQILIVLLVLVLVGGVSIGTQTAGEVEKPLLSIGVVSDHQLSNTTGENMDTTIKAFNYFRSHGADVVISAGDIADANANTVYSYFTQKYSEILGDVPLIAIPGNHDIIADGDLSAFRNYFGDPNKHVVIGGYHFITISSNTELGGVCNGNYGDAEIEFARTELAAASAATPEGQPIFLITHQHISNTVYGSDASSNWASDFLHGIVEDYENVVHLSGHSHFVLEDERSIWQGDFTAIGTSSMSYTELEYGKANGSVPPNAGDAKQFLFIQIFKNRIEIQRVKCSTLKQIKDKWVLDLPLEKSTFKHTDARAESRTAPYFEAGATANMQLVGNNLTVTFDAAKHDDFVQSYQFKLFKDGESEPIRNVLIFSDFYRGLENMQSTVSWTFEGVGADYQSYQVEIVPIESFGKRGDALACQLVFGTSAQVNSPPLSSFVFKTRFRKAFC